MDLTDLQLFANVGEANSLTKGAEFTHMSLSAASTRIKSLEEHLGAKLLLRTNHGVLLTDCGKVFLKHSQKVLDQLCALREELAEHIEGKRGQVRICAPRTICSEHLPQVLQKFLSSYPNVSVDVVERSLHDVVRQVRESNADIGIFRSDDQAGDGLVMFPYMSDRFVLAVAPSHPLAGRRAVSFDETVKFDYVGIQENHSIFKFVRQRTMELGVHLNVPVNARGFHIIARLIEANIGIGIIPENVAQRYAASLAIKVVYLTDSWAIRRWRIGVRNMESLPEHARTLIKLLRKAGSASTLNPDHDNFNPGSTPLRLIASE